MVTKAAATAKARNAATSERQLVAVVPGGAARLQRCRRARSGAGRDARGGGR